MESKLFCNKSDKKCYREATCVSDKFEFLVHCVRNSRSLHIHTEKHFTENRSKIQFYIFHVYKKTQPLMNERVYPVMREGTTLVILADLKVHRGAHFTVIEVTDSFEIFEVVIKQTAFMVVCLVDRTRENLEGAEVLYFSLRDFTDIVHLSVKYRKSLNLNILIVYYYLTKINYGSCLKILITALPLVMMPLLILSLFHYDQIFKWLYLQIQSNFPNNHVNSTI